MADSESYRRSHCTYIPQVVRSPKQNARHNMNCIQYNNIKIRDDSGHNHKASNQKKHYLQEEYVANNQRSQKTKHSKNISEHTQERVLECYLQKDFYHNTVIKSSEQNEETAPLPTKKINFIIPPENDKPKLDNEKMDWNDYHRLETIYKFMDDLEADFPSICTTSIIGTSIEGRNLKILKISNSNANNASVWVDAGIHAREWIAPAVNTFLADYISRNFDTLPESIKNKDWYFLPVINPDGYEYSHTTDRMWRKNRAWNGRQCVGVDLNRNFSYGWGGRGSSENPSSAFYRGPEPFSEPESSAIRDTFINSGIKFEVYITLHSYGQIIIFPYACSSQLSPNYVRLLQGATAMSKAIYDTNGNTYKVGISRDVMYGAAGTSNDFAHGIVGIPYCYLIELRSKKHRFKLPKEEIEETGNEILNCVKALMQFIDTTYTDKKAEQSEQEIGTELKKIDPFVKQNNYFVHKSNTSIRLGNSNIRKQESYNKRNYSYAKKSDTSLKNRDSYIRWSKSGVKKKDSYENTGDSLLKGADSFVETRDNLEKGCNFIEKRNIPIGKTGDSLIKRKGYFIQNNDIFEKGTNTSEKLKDSVEKKNISFVDTPDAYAKRVDSFLQADDSFVERFKCLDVASESSLEDNDSFSYEKRDGFFMKTRGTTIEKTENKKGWLNIIFFTAVNIWKEERSTMDILVEGPRAAQVAGMFHEREIPYSIAITDLQALLEREQFTSLTKTKDSSDLRNTMDWNNYHRLDTIYAFLDGLAAEYPYLCSVIVIGRSVEGRDMKVLKISNGNETNSGVWLDGAIHPREWISPAVVTYIADRIVRTFDEQPLSVTNKDWYILPVMNPDGYEYTHTHDRMWRKNRAHYGECVGVDLNRNFSYGFGEKGEEGSSDDPGNVFYRGPKAFSEPETAAVRRVILETSTKFMVFLSFHSYGEVIIFPWGYTSEACPDYVELLEGGTAMAKAIHSTNGNTYKVGSTKDLMYYASGTSIDWSYAVTNIPYSYMVELRGKTHRFLLPRTEIISTAAEVLNGVVNLMEFVDKRCSGSQTCTCPK